MCLQLSDNTEKSEHPALQNKLFLQYASTEDKRQVTRLGILCNLFFNLYKKFIKPYYKTIASLKLVKRNVDFFIFLKLLYVENYWHFMYLRYQISNYHPEKVLNMNLMYPINIYQKTKTKNKTKTMTCDLSSHAFIHFISRSSTFIIHTTPKNWLKASKLLIPLSSNPIQVLKVTHETISQNIRILCFQQADRF